METVIVNSLLAVSLGCSILLIFSRPIIKYLVRKRTEKEEKLFNGYKSGFDNCSWKRFRNVEMLIDNTTKQVVAVSSNGHTWRKISG